MAYVSFWAAERRNPRRAHAVKHDRALCGAEVAGIEWPEPLAANRCGSCIVLDLHERGDIRLRDTRLPTIGVNPASPLGR